MLENAPLDFDLSCTRCEYNLRGLQAANLCPECGTPILESLSSCDPVESFDRIDALRRSLMQPIAQQLGCRVDALLFVYDALMIAAEASVRSGSTQLSAASIAQAFQARVVEYFNHPAEAISLLAEWGIRRSEDVGRIIAAMASAGLLRDDACEPSDRFSGLFDSSTLWNPSAG